MTSGYAIRVASLGENETYEGMFYVEVLDLSLKELPICQLCEREQATLFEDLAQATIVAESYTDQEWTTGGRLFDGFEIELIRDGSGLFLPRDSIKDQIAAMAKYESEREKDAAVSKLEMLHEWLFSTKRQRH